MVSTKWSGRVPTQKWESLRLTTYTFKTLEPIYIILWHTSMPFCRRHTDGLCLCESAPTYLLYTSSVMQPMNRGTWTSTRLTVKHNIFSDGGMNARLSSFCLSFEEQPVTCEWQLQHNGHNKQSRHCRFARLRRRRHFLLLARRYCRTLGNWLSGRQAKTCSSL